jgi:selenocysteine lyase/cysteine desulfurase
MLSAREAAIEIGTVRSVIRQKLKDGRLPLRSTPRFWGGPGSLGESRNRVDAVVRASVHYHNDESEVERFVRAVTR